MNLIEGIFEQCDRCRDVLKDYEAIGTPGIPGKILIQAQIQDISTAIASGDVIRMLQAYAGLEEVKS